MHIIIQTQRELSKSVKIEIHLAGESSEISDGDAFLLIAVS